MIQEAAPKKTSWGFDENGTPCMTDHASKDATTVGEPLVDRDGKPMKIGYEK